jgi:hypothetical protein
MVGLGILLGGALGSEVSGVFADGSVVVGSNFTLNSSSPSLHASRPGSNSVCALPVGVARRATQMVIPARERVGGRTDQARGSSDESDTLHTRVSSSLFASQSRSPAVSGKLVCAVVIAHVPQSSAGNAWAFLNWALGFRQAGWDVWLVEQLNSRDLSWPEGERVPGGSRNERLWREVTAEFGFESRATLFLDDAAASADAFTEFAREAEVFVNLSGHFKLHHRVREIPTRVYVDMDPAFTQLWADVCHVDMNFAGHTHFFSYGACLATSVLPRTGHDWLPTLPPVCLDFWSPEATERDTTPLPAEAVPHGAWTTVTHWYGYNPLPWDGRIYGNKRDSLIRIRDLPKYDARLLVATDLQVGWEDYDDFVSAGWRFISAAVVCSDWRVYRKFLAASAGELCVAKDGYVVSECGWFSDRSTCYLALGRPVALQETGWSRALPTGEGLKSWRHVDEAARVLREFAEDPERHSAAARRIAHEHFDAAKVARQLLAELSR